MLFKSLAFLVLAVGAAAVPSISKRGTMTDMKIYAYGVGINGLPILADSTGNAYVSTADVQPANLSSLVWTISTDGATEWTVAYNSTNSTTTSNGTLYIIPTTDTYGAVGFGTAPSGAVTTPFYVYGEQVQYLTDSLLEAQFWAKTINGTTESQIMWNSDGSSQTDSTPVVLKTTGPVTA
ncbi:hypothetical protein LSUE1_G002249 [Lachnellula suecica]|uniref:Uncharacterized protein n=1 Tax=Lachnellula suecica TaxID=602035 RepID=A0A8T9C9M1_9HELO|nr:hypothetical protein LSUE1_G002249 [Lachnellula suecica]